MLKIETGTEGVLVAGQQRFRRPHQLRELIERLQAAHAEMIRGMEAEEQQFTFEILAAT